MLGPVMVQEQVNAPTESGKHVWLRLKDLFVNQELEFDFTLSDLKIAFESLELSQPKTAFANA